MRGRTGVGSVSVAIATAIAVCACDEKKPEVSAADAAAAATATAPREIVNGPPTAGAVADAGMPPRCRVMQSENGPPASADATGWLALDEKASFTTRASESGRELRFEGRGRVRPCGSDVALVAQGTAVALPGGGLAPGAEQWIASPCAVVRFAAGVTKVVVTTNECTVHVLTGNASLYVPEGARADDADSGVPLAENGVVAGRGWQRIVARRVVRVRPPPRGAAKAIAACESAATTARAAANAVAHASQEKLGERTVASMDARSIVRAACALAEARLEAEVPRDRPDGGETRIANATRGILGPP